MKIATLVLLISGAAAANAQDDAAARIRHRLELEMKDALETARKSLRELVLKELASAGIGDRSLAGQVERFAKALVDDPLHNRLRGLLLSREGRDLVEQFMTEQNLDNVESLVESYFEKQKNGKFRVREEFEEVLEQMLDSVAPEPPPAGGLGIELRGLAISKLSLGGAAAEAGLRVGDTLVSIAGRELTAANVEEVMKALRPGVEVKVVYERDKSRTTVTVKPK